MIDDVRAHPRALATGEARVLVAVRHPVMRRYAAELLEFDSAPWVSAATSGTEMVASAIQTTQPDVLVVDAGDFPGCCQAARTSFPRDRVIVIGPEPDPSYGDAALANGAAACIPRDNLGEELVPTLDRLLRRDDQPASDRARERSSHATSHRPDREPTAKARPRAR